MLGGNHPLACSRETLHLLRFQQLITHAAGGGELEVRLSELSSGLAHMFLFNPFTHNPLPPVRCSAISNGGCHGQSPEPAADLVQVALRLLSSLRNCHDL